MAQIIDLTLMNDNTSNNSQGEPPVYCRFTEMRQLTALAEHPLNPNTHPESQLQRLAEVIRGNGWRQPITVSDLSGYITKGHGRYQAAMRAGFSMVPVEVQHYENEAAEVADMLADNKIAELAQIDETKLADAFGKLPDTLADMSGYTTEEVTKVLASVQDLDDVPESMELDAENASSSERLNSLQFDGKRIFLQPDEEARLRKFLNDFSDRYGNYNGLCLELLEHGDAAFRNTQA